VEHPDRFASKHGGALSRADAAWLHMEQPPNHFVVTSLALLDEPLEMDRLREALWRKLPALPRLTQRVAEPGWPLASPRWEAVPTSAWTRTCTGSRSLARVAAASWRR